MKQSEKIVASVAIMKMGAPRTARELSDLLDISMACALNHLSLMHDAGLVAFHSWDARQTTRGPKPARWVWV